MSLNVPNLDKLIAHLEAQPPERINMGFAEVKEQPKVYHNCGTCGCILGHAALVWPKKFGRSAGTMSLAEHLSIAYQHCEMLTYPFRWSDEKDGIRRYPAHRVIATLKRLRDRFLATGEIVVDWGAEPGQEPAQPWSPPLAVERTLPEEITRLLAPKGIERVEG